MTRDLIGTVTRHPDGRYACQRPDGSWFDTLDTVATFGPAFGGLFAYDVGKRIYRVDGVYQMENTEQLVNRLAKETP